MVGLRICLTAIWVIQCKDRGLRESIRRSETSRMVRVAFDFDGAAFLTFRQYSGCIAAKGERSGEIERVARHKLLRPANASEAAVNFKNWRRLSVPAARACRGNSRSKSAWNSSVSANSSRLRQ